MSPEESSRVYIRTRFPALRTSQERHVARGSLATALALLSFAMTGVVDRASAAPHVVMISIDGLRPEVYREPETLGLQMPNLVALRDAGVSAARMIPVFPSVTYPAHTTLVTGTRPSEHGIVTNFKSGSNWYLDSAEIRSQTLWAAAKAAGLSTAIVTWPASYGAEVDYRIPENLSFGIADVPKAIRDGSTPGLFESLEPGCAPVEIPSFEALDAGEKLDRVTTCFAAGVLRAHRPALLLVHFLDADHRQHFFGPDSAEARHAFEQIDGYVGELRAAAEGAGIGDETVFAIVGDHGFVPVHTNLNLHAILLETGFARLSEPEHKVVPAPELSVAALGGSAAVYLRNPKDRALAKRLEAAFAAELERRYAGLIQLLPRAELDRQGAFPGAAFGLAASEGYMLVGVDRPEPTFPTGALKGMHGYLPSMPAMATGFVAAGPGLRRGVELPLVRQLDVAPTIAVLLGVKLNRATGVPIAGIFESADRGPGIGIPSAPK